MRLFWTLTITCMMLSACRSPLLYHRMEGPPPAALDLVGGSCVTGLCYQLRWVTGPTTSGPDEFEIKIESMTSDSQLSVELWMPDHGHGSAPVEIEALGSGVFRVREVYFIMPGFWELRFNWHSDNDGREVSFVERVDL